LRYTAPELLDDSEAKTADASADVFALALLAFELLIGRPVFDTGLPMIRLLMAISNNQTRAFLSVFIPSSRRCSATRGTASRGGGRACGKWSRRSTDAGRRFSLWLILCV
jgi:serine/threonine protein kinase